MRMILFFRSIRVSRWESWTGLLVRRWSDSISYSWAAWSADLLHWYRRWAITAGAAGEDLPEKVQATTGAATSLWDLVFVIFVFSIFTFLLYYFFFVRLTFLFYWIILNIDFILYYLILNDRILWSVHMDTHTRTCLRTLGEKILCWKDYKNYNVNNNISNVAFWIEF